MLIVDAHVDLSMNALEWNRDLRQPLRELNNREIGLDDKPGRAHAVVSLPELREGNIGLVVATQIARYVSISNPLPGWHSPQQAWAQTQGQWAWYKAMEEAGEMKNIIDLPSLDAHLENWSQTQDHRDHPIGYILSLEGADSLITPKHLERAYRTGLRAVGPAHYGPGRYGQGTDATGGLGNPGRALLKEMERLNIILDTTHLCDESFWEALSHFRGHIWASHTNCRALVAHHRQYSDDQIQALKDREAVIGMAFDAWMMVPDWVKGVSKPRQMNCTISTIVDHIDHICQLTGSSRYVGIGSDLDGGFGREQCPADLGTIADLQSLEGHLSARGYPADDIENILHGNLLRFLRRAWS